MSLIAISLCVGLLVDDAIVVLESIHREVETGVELNEAASVGTAKVASAVIASTLSVIAVFLPIAFTSGLIGVFFYQYGMTVSVAVAFSLFVSVTLTPMLSSRFLKKSEGHKGLSANLELTYERLESTYVKSVRVSLQHRRLVLLLAACAVAMGAFFAASVRAPIVAVILLMELTAAYELLLPLLIACATASVVAHMLGGRPIYAMLLERTLSKVQHARDADASKAH